MSGEDLPYNRPTSPQSSLSQPITDSLSTDGGIVRSWCNSAVVGAILYLSRRCDVGMYRSWAGVVTRGLSLRGRSAVRPVSLSRCLRRLTVRILEFIALAHLQSSCLLAACLRHVHADEQGPWASFIWCFSELVERLLYSDLSFHNCDLNCLPSVNC